MKPGTQKKTSFLCVPKPREDSSFSQANRLGGREGDGGFLTFNQTAFRFRLVLGQFCRVKTGPRSLWSRYHFRKTAISIDIPPGPVPRSSDVPLFYLNTFPMLFAEVQHKGHWAGHCESWVTSLVEIFFLSITTKKDPTRQMLYFPYLGKQHRVVIPPSCSLALFLNAKGVWDDEQVELRKQGRGFKRNVLASYVIRVTCTFYKPTRPCISESYFLSPPAFPQACCW